MSTAPHDRSAKRQFCGHSDSQGGHTLQLRRHTGPTGSRVHSRQHWCPACDHWPHWALPHQVCQPQSYQRAWEKAARRGAPGEMAVALYTRSGAQAWPMLPHEPLHILTARPLECLVEKDVESEKVQGHIATQLTGEPGHGRRGHVQPVHEVGQDEVAEL